MNGPNHTMYHMPSFGWMEEVLVREVQCSYTKAKTFWWVGVMMVLVNPSSNGFEIFISNIFYFCLNGMKWKSLRTRAATGFDTEADDETLLMRRLDAVICSMQRRKLWAQWLFLQLLTFTVKVQTCFSSCKTLWTGGGRKRAPAV